MEWAVDCGALKINFYKIEQARKPNKKPQGFGVEESGNSWRSARARSHMANANTRPSPSDVEWAPCCCRKPEQG